MVPESQGQNIKTCRQRPNNFIYSDYFLVYRGYPSQPPTLLPRRIYNDEVRCKPHVNIQRRIQQDVSNGGGGGGGAERGREEGDFENSCIKMAFLHIKCHYWVGVG